MKRFVKNKKSKLITSIMVFLLMLLPILGVYVYADKTFADNTDIAAMEDAFTLSEASINIAVGQSKKVTVSSEDYVGIISVSSSDSSIASVDSEQIFLDIADNANMVPSEITIEAKAVGNTTITLTTTSEFANFNTEEAAPGITKTIAVKVVDGETDPVTPPTPESVTPTADDAEEDVAVPSTSGTTSKTTKPDTGDNTKNTDGGSNAIFYILPIIAIAVVVALYLRRGGKVHRKFER